MAGGLAIAALVYAQVKNLWRLAPLWVRIVLWAFIAIGVAITLWNLVSQPFGGWLGRTRIFARFRDASSPGCGARALYDVPMPSYDRDAMNPAMPIPRIGGMERIVAAERIRSVRLQRHLAVAGIALIACALTSSAMSTPLGFGLANVFVAIAINSVARGVDARFGHWWGRLYAEPKESTGLDRFVDRMIHRPDLSGTDEPEPQVRPLDPFE